MTVGCPVVIIPSSHVSPPPCSHSDQMSRWRKLRSFITLERALRSILCLTSSSSFSDCKVQLREGNNFLRYQFYFSVLESVGNTFRNDDEGGERNFLTTGDITPLVWTDEEPMKRLNNGNPVEETLHKSSAQQSDSLSKTKIRNRKRIFLNQQLKHLQLELSQLERDVELMKSNDMFYYLEM